MKCPHSFVLPRPGGHDRFERVRFDKSVQVVTGITIPCGKCLICRQNRAREWAQRLTHELEFHHQYCFITLTYSDEYLPIIQDEVTLWKPDLQLFWKRLRKDLGGKIRIKYLACGEYGDRTSRPHYHAIIFGWQPSDSIRISPDVVSSETLEKLWKFGQVAVGAVTQESIHYVTGYVLKKLPKKALGNRKAEFICVSQGMGLKYATMYQEDVVNGSLLTNGVEKGIPMYYRRKINIDKLAYTKRRIKKDAVLEKQLQRRSEIEVPKQVEKAQQQNELDLEAKLNRQGKGTL